MYKDQNKRQYPYELIQSEKATCSSLRTVCVVPWLEASDIPLWVSMLSRLWTIFLKFTAKSFSSLSLA